MDIQTITIIGGFSVSIISIAASIITTLINKKNEFKKAQFQTLIDCAYKEWQDKNELVKYLSEKNGGPAEFVPFIDYLIFYSRFLKIINKNKITDEDIKNFIFENGNIRNKYYKYIKEFKAVRN